MNVGVHPPYHTVDHAARIYAVAQHGGPQRADAPCFFPEHTIVDRGSPRTCAGSPGDAAAEAGQPPVTEVCGTARTTRSDPGRRSLSSYRTGPDPKRVSASFASSQAAHASSESSMRGSTGGSAAGGRASPDGDGAAPLGANKKKKKHQHRGSKPSSRAALDLPGHVMVVEVVDTGTGVSESARQRLFGQFVQGSDKEMEQPRSVSGTGLGLSICARQVRTHATNLAPIRVPQSNPLLYASRPQRCSWCSALACIGAAASVC